MGTMAGTTVLCTQYPARVTIGPGIITRHIGTRSMEIRLNGKDFQRDAGMIMLEKPRIADEDPAIRNRRITKTHKHNNISRITHPLQEGEFVIIKDDPGASDWYCAGIRKILADRIEVNYYTTITGDNRIQGRFPKR
jgi:hypothetical protein